MNLDKRSLSGVLRMSRHSEGGSLGWRKAAQYLSKDLCLSRLSFSCSQRHALAANPSI